jgi:hypothetical protein
VFNCTACNQKHEMLLFKTKWPPFFLLDFPYKNKNIFIIYVLYYLKGLEYIMISNVVKTLFQLVEYLSGLENFLHGEPEIYSDKDLKIKY